jgi:VCBS repeat protein
MTRTRRQHRALRIHARPVKLYLEALEGRDLPSFITAPSYPVGENAEAVAVGDFDGDAVSDLAVALKNVNGSVTILKGNGDGSFQLLGGVAVGKGPTDLIAAELTGDGVLDLAVAQPHPGTVHVLVGNGDGSFQPPVSYAVSATRILVAGDFDGDNDLDLAAADYFPWGNGKVLVLINSGTGNFTSGGTYDSGT